MHKIISIGIKFKESKGQMCLYKSEMTLLKSENLQSLNRECKLTPELTILALMGNAGSSGALNSMTRWSDYLRVESKCLLCHSLAFSSGYLWSVSMANYRDWDSGWACSSPRLHSTVLLLEGIYFFPLSSGDVGWSSGLFCSFSTSLSKALSVSVWWLLTIKTAFHNIVCWWDIDCPGRLSKL